MVLNRIAQVIGRPMVQYGFFDFFEAIGDFFTETIPNFFTGIGEAIANFGQSILDAVLEALNTFFGTLLWALECGLCKLIDLIYSMYSVFAGMQRVTLYNVSASGQRTVSRQYLLNILLGQSVVTKLYWGMAIIGIILAIAFTIWAVLRKAGDLFDRERRTLGEIMANLFKSVIIILLMSFIMNVVVAFSGALMSSISSLFDIAVFGGNAEVKVFTSDDFVYMNSILDTIGAYSLNPSYNSRYNINSCYNAIRPKLQYLEKKGVFDVYYITEESKVYNGTEYETVVNTWQSVIQEIVRANNVDTELKLDVFYETVNRAILNAMEVIRTDASFQPLSFYEATYVADTSSNNISLGTIVYLSGTGEAARNPSYNTSASITDAIRGPYYNGTKSIYNYDTLAADFSLGAFGGVNHVMIILLACLILRPLIQMTATASIRLFHMILLYITAPPFIATIPLGEGSLFPNWKKTLMLETFGIFGSVISMRLLMVYIPLIASSNLELFSNGFMNMVSKAVLIWGGVEAAKRGTTLINGILSGNTMAAVHAMDAEKETGSFLAQTGFDAVTDAPQNVANKALGIGRRAVFGLNDEELRKRDVKRRNEKIRTGDEDRENTLNRHDLDRRWSKMSSGAEEKEDAIQRFDRNKRYENIVSGVEGAENTLRKDDINEKMERYRQRQKEASKGETEREQKSPAVSGSGTGSAGVPAKSSSAVGQSEQSDKEKKSK